jgi:hypothetical protein
MVDYNLIHSLGNMDDEVNSAVATALGDAAGDLNKLIREDEAQDFTPARIIKGKVSGMAGDDFIVELGLKSEGILERSSSTTRTTSRPARGQGPPRRRRRRHRSGEDQQAQG